jgi:hypothetical protein
MAIAPPILMNKKLNPVSISPNSIKGSFRIRYPREAGNTDISVDLLDAGGIRIDVPIRINYRSRDSIDITIAHQFSGIFYLKIKDGQSYIFKKLILQ